MRRDRLSLSVCAIATTICLLFAGCSRHVSGTASPDFAKISRITVAGRQTLSLKGDKSPRVMSTILNVTVQKADQNVSALESLDKDGKPGPMPAPTR